MKLKIEFSRTALAAIAGLTAAIRSLTEDPGVSIGVVEESTDAQSIPEAVQEKQKTKTAGKSKTTKKVVKKAADVEAPKQEPDVCEEPGRAITLEELRAILIQASGERGEHREAVLEVIKSYGVDTLPEIPEDKWESVAADIKKLNGRA